MNKLFEKWYIEIDDAFLFFGEYRGKEPYSYIRLFETENEAFEYANKHYKNFKIKNIVVISL